MDLTQLASQAPQNTVSATNTLNHSEVARDWQTIRKLVKAAGPTSLSVFSSFLERSV